MIDFHQFIPDQSRKKEISTFESVDELVETFLLHEKEMMDKGFVKINIVMNQPTFILNDDLIKAIREYRVRGDNRLLFTLMASPEEAEKVVLRIKQIKSLDNTDCIVGIKFHPIFQDITSDKYNGCVMIAKAASKNKMFIMVDGSYGAPSVFRVNHLELAELLCRNVTTPIVLAHCGCLKVKEAMLIALETPNQNLYFDTSFILHFWEGSSVEKDFEFSLKKLGVSKYFFASDFPYLNLDEEIEQQKIFLDRIKLNDEEKFHYFQGAAINFLRDLAK